MWLWWQQRRNDANTKVSKIATLKKWTLSKPTLSKRYYYKQNEQEANGRPSKTDWSLNQIKANFLVEQQAGRVGLLNGY